MLLRKFDEDVSNYINTKAKLPFYENEYYLLVINDEVLKQRMKKQPQSRYFVRNGYGIFKYCNK